MEILRTAITILLIRYPELGNRRPSIGSVMQRLRQRARRSTVEPHIGVEQIRLAHFGTIPIGCYFDAAVLSVDEGSEPLIFRCVFRVEDINCFGSGLNDPMQPDTSLSVEVVHAGSWRHPIIGEWVRVCCVQFDERPKIGAIFRLKPRTQ